MIRGASRPYAEAFWLADDAAQAAVLGNVAVADSAFDENSSLRRGNAIAYHAPVLSRGHAAHMLLGAYVDPLHEDADLALPIVDRQPLRTTAPSRRANQALAHLREAGLHPGDIVDPNVSVKALIAGGEELQGHYLLKHLWEVYGGDISAEDAESYYRMTGLEEEDFAAARQLMTEDIRAFDRSMTATLPPLALPPASPSGESRTTEYPRYAATSSSPGPMPAALLVRRVVDAPKFVSEATKFDDPVDARYARRSYAHFLDYARSAAIELLRHEDSFGMRNIPSQAAEGLAAVSMSAPNPLSHGYRGGPSKVCDGRVWVAPDPYGPKVDTAILGYPANEVVLVTTQDGVRCLDGLTEGAECDPAEHVVVPTSEVDTSGAGVGYDVASLWELTGARAAEALATRAVFVYEVVTASDSGRVAYRHLATAPTGMEGGKTATVPVNCELNQETSDVVHPPGKDQRPPTSCTGLPANQRIPLENELSEDGSAYENSWRGYLDRALQAAGDADALGESLIEQGLTMDLGAESALAELERLCGTAIDIDGFPGLSLTETAPPIYGGECDAGGTCSTDGYACQRGTCVLDPLQALLNDISADPSAFGTEGARLAACLGPQTDERLVSLGRHELCVWVDATNPNAICKCPEGETCGACPEFLGTSASCELKLADRPAGTEVMTVPGLNLFASEGAATPGMAYPSQDEMKAAVAAFRSYRYGNESALQAADVKQALRILHPSVSSYIAEGIRFEATPFNTGYLFRGDETWFGTGTHEGPSANWPCADTPIVACESGEAGLLCQNAINCEDATERQAFTTRMAEAALAARVITGARLDGLEFPVIPRNEGGLNEEDNYARGAARSVYSDPVFSGGTELYAFSKSEVGCEDSRAERVYDSAWDASVWRSEGSGAPLAWGSTAFFRNVMTTVNYGHAAGLAPPNSAQISATNWLESVWISGEVSLPVGEPSWSDRTEWDYSNYWRTSDERTTCRAERSNVNAAFVAARGLSQQNVLDAIELLLEFDIDRAGNATSPVGDPRCNPERPPAVSSVDDLPRLEEYLRCVGDRVQQRGERTVFADLPESVIDVLRNEGGVGVYPELGGEFATAVTQLRRGLIEMQSISPLVSREIGSFSEDIKQLDLLMQSLDIRDDLAGFRLGSAIADRVTQCATQAATTYSNGAKGYAGRIVAAAITCVNSVVQIALAVQVRAGESMLLNIEEQTAFSQFVQTLNQRITNVDALQRRVRDAQEDIDSGLASLESIRVRGERAVARALFADSDDAGRMFRTNTVARRRYNTTLERYKLARGYALQMAFLARVALEQRLGISLLELGDLSLVENPAKWVGSLCESSLVDAAGLDYTRIRDITDGEYETYEGEYVGDYVRRLSAVVESYRIDYPLHDGSDTAVVSLRDDVFQTRAPCDFESINMFARGGLDSVDDPSSVEVEGAWRPSMCADVEGAIVDCVGADPVLGAGGMSMAATHVDSHVPARLGPPTGLRVVFGDATRIGEAADQVTGSFGSDTRFEQTVIAEPGRRYRLSWYGRQSSSALTTDQVVGVYAPNGAGGESELDGDVEASGEGDLGWSRYYRFFDTFGRDEAVTVVVAILPDTSEPLRNQFHELAGFMLEDVTERVIGDEGSGYVVSEHPPAMFHASIVSGFACEDTSGFYFRANAWSRVCENRCPASIASCAEDVLEPQCYRELSFTVTPQSLESGDFFAQSSFARGNYNYRIDSMALNFVGTALRDCSGADWPSTCYASGSVPFSIDHLGPFPVTNHTGASDYEAPLFNGRIVHGRGLAAERYITNPISGADRGLVDPYLHREFRGRPLNGTYRVRLWEEPGVRFDRLEDVQIVLNYRYWTRLD